MSKHNYIDPLIYPPSPTFLQSKVQRGTLSFFDVVSQEEVSITLTRMDEGNMLLTYNELLTGPAHLGRSYATSYLLH